MLSFLRLDERLHTPAPFLGTVTELPRRKMPPGPHGSSTQLRGIPCSIMLSSCSTSWVSSAVPPLHESTERLLPSPSDLRRAHVTNFCARCACNELIDPRGFVLRSFRFLLEPLPITSAHEPLFMSCSRRASAVGSSHAEFSAAASSREMLLSARVTVRRYSWRSSSCRESTSGWTPSALETLAAEMARKGFESSGMAILFWNKLSARSSGTLTKKSENSHAPTSMSSRSSWTRMHSLFCFKAQRTSFASRLPSSPTKVYLLHTSSM
mmetsp:Transcript_45918/g.113948  ORF Transcript_45918/g.113948 Transcript_45918/m.113948 type:complete len:267 (-) Transcript_45918:126-926(-)